jgi:hypothetical protein
MKKRRKNMKTKPVYTLLVFVLVLSLISLACQALTGGNEVEPTVETGGSEQPVEEKAEPTKALPTKVPQIAPTSNPQSAEIRQWAVSATASSEYGSDDWSAMQATGAPDTPECGDYTTAWASSGSDTLEWIELIYATPVFPRQVIIHITYNPSQVTRVELLDEVGNYHQVFTANSHEVAECPYILTLDVPADLGVKVVGVRITIDQSVIGNWNEIDAVELVGQT